jgi:hypothetical protein
MIGAKRKTANTAVLPNHNTNSDQAAACAFHFLRQPSRLNAPSPEAKSGRVAGRGVATGAIVQDETVERPVAMWLTRSRLSTNSLPKTSLPWNEPKLSWLFEVVAVPKKFVSVNAPEASVWKDQFANNVL